MAKLTCSIVTIFYFQPYIMLSQNPWPPETMTSFTNNSVRKLTCCDSLENLSDTFKNLREVEVSGEGQGHCVQETRPLNGLSKNPTSRFSWLGDLGPHRQVAQVHQSSEEENQGDLTRIKSHRVKKFWTQIWKCEVKYYSTPMLFFCEFLQIVLNPFVGILVEQ